MIDQEEKWQPPVTVILCLRGRDPSLPDCVQAMLSQEYDDYRLLCVLDNKDDPAAEVVNSFASDHRLSVLVAQPLSRRCSLKCNSLVAAFEKTDDRFAVLVDADTLPDSKWLADLVAPLKDSQVVATSGNRWFIPEDRSVGSYVRYFWNMAAGPQMDAYQVTWGGSMALRTSFVRSSGLLESWKQSLFEDASVTRFARSAGKRVEMLPHLLVPNRESISYSAATSWIERQLLDTRLYHSCFPKVVLHCFSTLLLFVLAIICVSFLTFVDGGSRAAIVLGMCFANYVVFYAMAWIVLDKCARDVLKNRGHALPKRKWLSPVALFSVVATQVAYTMATWKALRTKQVTWRDIDYRIHGPESIEMMEYQVIQLSDSPTTRSI